MVHDTDGLAMSSEDHIYEGCCKIGPGSALRGTIRVPGDKSISHRAIMLSAIAQGEIGRAHV